MKDRYDIRSDGFCGRWFAGTKHNDRAVIVIPGSWTSEDNSVKQFAYINKAGFSVLLLGHSLWSGMDNETAEVPVEYVEKAMVEMKNNGIEHVAVFGLSFGARFALLAASLLSGIEVVIAASPYDYITEAVHGITKPLGKSVHIFRGKPLSFAPIKVLHGSLFKGFIKLLRSKEYSLKSIMRYGYDSCEEKEECRIRTEDITADILLLAPGYDDCWPSDRAVRRMERLIKDSGRCGRIKAVTYSKGSHILATDLEATPDRLKKMHKTLRAEVNDPNACDNARRESIAEVISFLNTWANKRGTV